MIAYKRILNFENYQIGTDGSIWSLRASVPKRLKPQVKTNGFLKGSEKQQEDICEHMSNNEIVEKYYPFIMELKQKFGADDDCVQMIFVEILEYSNPKLNQLDSKNELKFWITRLFKNYWFSKTSRYYYTYKKYYEIVKEPLEQQNDELEDWLNETED